MISFRTEVNTLQKLIDTQIKISAYNFKDSVLCLFQCKYEFDMWKHKFATIDQVWSEFFSSIQSDVVSYWTQKMHCLKECFLVLYKKNHKTFSFKNFTFRPFHSHRTQFLLGNNLFSKKTFEICERTKFVLISDWKREIKRFCYCLAFVSQQ